jgi:GT2 family glycosyltransferase
MAAKEDTLTIGWCDSGTTDGKFTQGLTYTLVGMFNLGSAPADVLRVHGNQIARQRQVLFDTWADTAKTDWLLWLDSDIVLNKEILMKLLSAADKTTRPIISGVYFVSKQDEGILSYPLPAIFRDIDDFNIEHIHPLPVEEVIEIDCAGMGLVLMHRSIVPILRKAFPNESLFAEKNGLGKEYVGEDIAFFRRVKEAGVPVYAHTGAIAQHMKRFNFDAEYYSLWWNSQP